ncbi:hypothetical protein TD95_004610 [Thielaviopsis punctulata]|uniref:Purine-cytosine permease n=1 Tax=Thielaviopsis punctulata TaxID=72032 RepID=A0A0F4ZH28_9PEZI|nr:hypothetical protein TD95_004610 [Thielaviopsis punctulata]
MEKIHEKTDHHSDSAAAEMIDPEAGLKGKMLAAARFFGIEMEAIEPVAMEQKTDRHYFKVFTLWFTMNFSLIGISTGMSGPLAFGLGLRDSSLTILFFGLLTCIPASFLSTFGAQLGLRQMTHARYSFGAYIIAIPILLNAATLTGYAIVGYILGAQALVAIHPSDLSIDGGIVIIAIITLIIVIFGARVIHWFDLYAWFPTLVALIVALGYSGHHLKDQVSYPDATGPLVLTYGCLVAGFFLPWSAIASDFTVYFDPRCSKTMIFCQSYFGLVIGGLPCMILGAAIGGAVPNVASWQAGYDATSVGGVLGAMLAPAGGGGKFLLFVLAMSVMGNAAGTLYALTINVQALVAMAWRSVHRIVFQLILTGIIIGVSIKAAESFLDSLNNFLGIIAYWPAPFMVVIVLEHFVIRKGRLDNYNLAAWDTPKELPAGVAAIVAGVLSVALIVPCMDQIWYVGPIAKKTGDIGFEMAFVVTAIFYVPLRKWEIRRQGRV